MCASCLCSSCSGESVDLSRKVRALLLAVDVHYKNACAVVAGIGFEHWTDKVPASSYVSTIEQVGDYIPGEFYKRELPCILKLLKEHKLLPTHVVIDGYVYLDGHSRPGLGKHLYDALYGKVKIVGVAKNPFKDIDDEYELYRGISRKPLYITCIGLPLSEAKSRIAAMSGSHRIPTLLKTVDQLCRQDSGHC
jgi:deoxyribonuclease V